jgi:molybdate transport system substrate-binding protein
MAPSSSDIRIQTLGIKFLFHPSVKKIAIANPAHAPYGMAAVAFMRGQNIYEKLKDKLVMGENISQAAQFVESGAAEVGIIALSIAIKARELGNVSYWEIPAATHPSIEQGFTILQKPKKHQLTKKFTDFVKSREGESILMKYGFNVPAGSRQ